MAKGQDVVPIPGTKRRTYLIENAGAVGLILSPTEIREIEAALPAREVVGERYMPGGMRSVDG
jgi:hypothetical protein